MKRLIISWILSGLFAGLMAQERLIRDESFIQRKNTIRSIPVDPEKTRAVRVANSRGFLSRRVYPDGRIMEIRRLNPNGKPEFLTTFNLNAARTISTDKVWQDGGNGLSLSGEGVVVGIWDGGILRVSHREFGERARNMNPLATIEGHSTHVSGTIGAAGIDGDARGMAGKVVLEGYDWDSDLSEMDAAAGEGLLLSNHSYGYVLGFDYNTEEERWEWWGDTDISEEEEYLFGFYHVEARAYDVIAHDHPGYLIVKSAGNDRGDLPDQGEEHYVWEDGDWVPSSQARPQDGGEDGFDCMGPVSTAKNILAVGAVRDLPGGYLIPGDVELTNYSAFGPTDDGRIKPDIVSNGEFLYSTYSDNDSDYRVSSGTSMAAPNVTGSLALLQEHYHALYGEYLKAASLKGLVLHTADDAGNPGPDYSFGWGLMNTRKAAEVISNTDFLQVQEHVLEEGNEIRIPLFHEGPDPVRATICWTDPPGNVPEISLDPPDRILVNDLDITIIRKADGIEFRPYILDPVLPGKPAARGDNVVDNVEQVLIENAEKGYYEIVIRHKGTLEYGSQEVALVFTGLVSEFYASGISSLTDLNGSFMLTSADEYLPNMQAGWLVTPGNGEEISLYFDFFGTEASLDVLRIHDGKDAGSPLLAELSGLLANPDTVITSTKDTMWIEFISDGQNQDKGFLAFYCTVPPEGTFEIQGESYPCVGSSETYLVSGQEGTYFTWLPPSGWNIQGDRNRYATMEVGSGNLLEVRPYNRCGEAQNTGLFTEPFSSAPELLSFTGDTVLCEGETGTLTVDSLTGAAYQWMLPDNWLGTSVTHKINFIPMLNTGQIRVTAFNSCAFGDTLSIAIQVNKPPGNTEIFSVSDVLCQNSTSRFYIFPEENTDYQWSVDPGWQIAGNNRGDTVDVEVGAGSSYLRVKATNECGFTNSFRPYTTAPAPDMPLLMSSESIYEPYRKLEVQNATAYRMIQWYRNNKIISGENGRGPSYVAFLPGTYTVEVANRDGCTLLQDSQDGINITGPNNLYTVYGGSGGVLMVQNNTRETATVNIYDMNGKLMVISRADPGINEIATTLKGAYVVSVKGLGNLHVFKLIFF